MNRFIAIWTAVIFIGCGVAHLKEHEQNAIVSGEHQVGLELCVQNALAQAKQDGGVNFAEYTACADAADKAAGKK